MRQFSRARIAGLALLLFSVPVLGFAVLKVTVWGFYDSDMPALIALFAGGGAALWLGERLMKQ